MEKNPLIIRTFGGKGVRRGQIWIGRRNTKKAQFLLGKKEWLIILGGLGPGIGLRGGTNLEVREGVGENFKLFFQTLKGTRIAKKEVFFKTSTWGKKFWAPFLDERGSSKKRLGGKKRITLLEKKRVWGKLGGIWC